MPRHIDVWMDGVALSTVGPILVRQVYEDPPTLEISNGERPGRYGQRKLAVKRQSLKVAVECQIRELRDLAARSRIREEIYRWANGSVLQLSNHPERHLNCYLSADPALGEARDYTSAIRIEWTADEVPFWEDDIPERLTLTGSGGMGDLQIQGTVQSPVSLTATAGGALTEFSVTAGGSTIVLTGLSIAQGGVITFERDALDNLMIRSGETVLLNKRTAASADDLMAGPGLTTVEYTADASCSVIFSARGRWA